jgi:surfeit locus 1 family protein
MPSKEGDAGEAQLHLHNGMPLGRPPTVDIRNAHLSYIITWYALSAFTTVMFAGVVRNRRRFVSKRLPR